MAGRFGDAVRPGVGGGSLTSTGFEPMLQALAAYTEWDPERNRVAYNALVELIAAYVRRELFPRMVESAANKSHGSTSLSERLASDGVLPMFGFPTHVRYLCTLPFGPGWPPSEGVVDRNLDLAITSFAPGTTVMKDKRVHTSAGVAGFAPGGFREGFNPPYDQPNPHHVGRCQSCQAVLFDLDPGTAGPCPQCGGALRLYDAREPLGFISVRSSSPATTTVAMFTVGRRPGRSSHWRTLGTRFPSTACALACGRPTRMIRSDGEGLKP